MAELAGNVALITGGSRGIGRGIARGLARHGASVAITARQEPTLREAAEEIEALGVPCLAVTGDVGDEPTVERLFDAVMERFGRLDVLVNNAGAFDSAPLDEFTLEAWNRVLTTNLTTPFLCTRAAMRIMKRQGSGRIINVASIAAQRVRPHSAAYSASKSGLWGLTQVTALEGRQHGIAASCLYPGNTFVERAQNAGGPMSQEPWMSVDELAQAAVWMALLPPHVTMLEATVLPINQPFIGRG
jgi:NAD(P)-dependent dehydrogenase (short-subunit alcohol dehydrogenase family)